MITQASEEVIELGVDFTHVIGLRKTPGMEYR
jgi:hypothetical protein